MIAFSLRDQPSDRFIIEHARQNVGSAIHGMAVFAAAGSGRLEDEIAVGIDARLTRCKGTGGIYLWQHRDEQDHSADHPEP